MRGPAGWSLRRRLLAAVLALSALGLLVAGALTSAALRSYLLDEVDRRLLEVSGPLASGDDGFRLPPGGSPGGFDGPAAFYTRLATPDGEQTRVSGVPLDAVDSPPDLPDLTYDEVAALAGEPFTVGSSGPDWRVVAWPLPDGSGTVMMAASLGAASATVTRLLLLQSVIGIVVLAAVALVGRWLVVRGLRPLTEVQTTAAEIAGGAIHRRVPFTDPATEVGALGDSFNSMLDRLQSAFEAQRASEAAARASEERMRQFIADASHELRTPLTTVRGFAELHRMGALATSQQTADAMARIESESARMGVMVEDLLMLARLDEQRAFAADGVDLAGLARRAVADACAAWPDQGFELDAPSELTVTGDADRLHQVVMNLLSNAARFNDGGPIGVAVARQGGEAVLTVSDHGPGVPVALREKVFGRFVRADDARSSSDGGAGLGLAIVSAIVTGHGGRVAVTDAPGGGARFEVRLPAQPR